MTLPSLRIHGCPGTDAFVFEIDGHDAKDSATAADLHMDADSIPTLTLDVRVPEVDIDGEATVVVPGATHRVLTALGWTPPGSDPGPDATEEDG